MDKEGDSSPMWATVADTTDAAFTNNSARNRKLKLKLKNYTPPQRDNDRVPESYEDYALKVKKLTQENFDLRLYCFHLKEKLKEYNCDIPTPANLSLDVGKQPPSPLEQQQQQQKPQQQQQQQQQQQGSQENQAAISAAQAIKQQMQAQKDNMKQMHQETEGLKDEVEELRRLVQQLRCQLECEQAELKETEEKLMAECEARQLADKTVKEHRDDIELYKARLYEFGEQVERLTRERIDLEVEKEKWRCDYLLRCHPTSHPRKPKELEQFLGSWKKCDDDGTCGGGGSDDGSVGSPQLPESARQTRRRILKETLRERRERQHEGEGGGIFADVSSPNPGLNPATEVTRLQGARGGARKENRALQRQVRRMRKKLENQAIEHRQEVNEMRELSDAMSRSLASRSDQGDAKLRAHLRRLKTKLDRQHRNVEHRIAQAIADNDEKHNVEKTKMEHEMTSMRRLLKCLREHGDAPDEKGRPCGRSCPRRWRRRRHSWSPPDRDPGPTTAPPFIYFGSRVYKQHDRSTGRTPPGRDDVDRDVSRRPLTPQAAKEERRDDYFSDGRRSEVDAPMEDYDSDRQKSAIDERKEDYDSDRRGDAGNQQDDVDRESYDRPPCDSVCPRGRRRSNSPRRSPRRATPDYIYCGSRVYKLHRSGGGYYDDDDRSRSKSDRSRRERSASPDDDDRYTERDASTVSRLRCGRRRGDRAERRELKDADYERRSASGQRRAESVDENYSDGQETIQRRKRIPTIKRGPSMKSEQDTDPSDASDKSLKEEVSDRESQTSRSRKETNAEQSKSRADERQADAHKQAERQDKTSKQSAETRKQSSQKDAKRRDDASTKDTKKAAVTVKNVRKDAAIKKVARKDDVSSKDTRSDDVSTKEARVDTVRRDEVRKVEKRTDEARRKADARAEGRDKDNATRRDESREEMRRQDEKRRQEVKKDDKLAEETRHDATRKDGRRVDDDKRLSADDTQSYDSRGTDAKAEKVTIDATRREEKQREETRTDKASNDDRKRDDKAKSDDAKREEAGKEEATQEYSQRTQTRREEAQRNETKTDKTQRTDTRRDGAKREERPREETRRDDGRRDETRRDETRRDEARRDQTQRDETRRDETKKDETRRDQTRRKDTRGEDARRQDGRRGETRRDNETREETRRDNARREETRREETRREETRRDETKRDRNGRDEARKDRSRKDDARTAQDDAKSEETRWDKRERVETKTTERRREETRRVETRREETTDDTIRDKGRPEERPKEETKRSGERRAHEAKKEIGRRQLDDRRREESPLKELRRDEPNRRGERRPEGREDRDEKSESTGVRSSLRARPDHGTSYASTPRRRVPFEVEMSTTVDDTEPSKRSDDHEGPNSRDSSVDEELKRLTDALAEQQKVNEELRRENEMRQNELKSKDTILDDQKKRRQVEMTQMINELKLARSSARQKREVDALKEKMRQKEKEYERTLQEATERQETLEHDKKRQEQEMEEKIQKLMLKLQGPPPKVVKKKSDKKQRPVKAHPYNPVLEWIRPEALVKESKVRRKDQKKLRDSKVKEYNDLQTASNIDRFEEIDVDLVEAVDDFDNQVEEEDDKGREKDAGAMPKSRMPNVNTNSSNSQLRVVAENRRLRLEIDQLRGRLEESDSEIQSLKENLEEQRKMTDVLVAADDGKEARLLQTIRMMAEELNDKKAELTRLQEEQRPQQSVGQQQQRLHLLVQSLSSSRESDSELLRHRGFPVDEEALKNRQQERRRLALLLRESREAAEAAVDAEYSDDESKSQATRELGDCVTELTRQVRFRCLELDMAESALTEFREAAEAERRLASQLKEEAMLAAERERLANVRLARLRRCMQQAGSNFGFDSQTEQEEKETEQEEKETEQVEKETEPEEETEEEEEEELIENDGEEQQMAINTNEFDSEEQSGEHQHQHQHQHQHHQQTQHQHRDREFCQRQKFAENSEFPNSAGEFASLSWLVADDFTFEDSHSRSRAPAGLDSRANAAARFDSARLDVTLRGLLDEVDDGRRRSREIRRRLLASIGQQATDRSGATSESSEISIGRRY